MKKYLKIMSKKTKVKCIGVVALALIGSYLASVWPVKLGELYTKISTGKFSCIEDGIGAVIVFGLIYLTAEIITILRRVILDCVIATHESEVRETSIEKLLKMPVAYYSGCLNAEKTAQLNQGVSGFSQLIKIMCNDVIATIIIAVCTLTQVFLHSPILMVAIMLSYLLITVLVSLFQIRSQNGIREKIVGAKNCLDGKICQSISNLEMIRSMNAEKYETKRLIPSILGIKNTEKKHHRYMGSFDCIKQACKIIFQAAILIVSLVLIMNNKMNPGAAITVCLLFQQLIKPIDEVYRFMDEIASSVIKAKALIEVVNHKSDKVFDIKSSNNNKNDNNIVIKDLVITNPEGDTKIACYEKIEIPGKTLTALVGPNGCGKSSLIRCLSGRFYPYEKGEIMLFGKNIDDYSQKELANTIFNTTQSPLFIAGTVRENLQYGLDSKIEDGVLIDALYKVHLVGTNHNDTVIKADPLEALDFELSEKANELSGGMKQRLSLARAYLRKPKLFVFDEITSNLDDAAEDIVLSNIESYARSINAGIVYISHNKKVIERCSYKITLHNKFRNKLLDKQSA